MIEPRSLARRVHRRFIQEPRTERLAPLLARLARGARTIVDVGTGTGDLAVEVARRAGADVVGVDVHVQPDAPLRVIPYDGDRLPFEDGAHDAVMLIDVLHHARDPDRLLAEARRVARAAIIVKDHFAFGGWSRVLLRAMDAANHLYGIGVPGTYLAASDWLDLTARHRLAMTEIAWPLEVHAPALGVITRPELQFAARLEPEGAAR